MIEIYSTTNDMEKATLIKQALLNNGIHAEYYVTRKTSIKQSTINILIKEKDFHEAIAILEEDFGIIYTDENEMGEGYESYILNWTSHIPFVNQLHPRLIFAVTIGILFLIIIILINYTLK